MLREALHSVDTVPVEPIDCILAGESPLLVWREHRRMTVARLAAAGDVMPAHISKLESAESTVGLLH